MYEIRKFGWISLAALVIFFSACQAFTSDGDLLLPIIVNHRSLAIDDIPTFWIVRAKERLHIAYGHTSHGSQLTTGMDGLVAFKGTQFAFNSGGSAGALDLRDYYGNFGGFGIADDLGNPDRTAWASATRAYLDQHPAVNVIL